MGYNNINNNKCVCVCACMCKCECVYLPKIKDKGIFRLSGGFKLSLWVISPLLGKSRLKCLKMALFKQLRYIVN